MTSPSDERISRGGQSGFTLLEILVVMVILGLVMLSVPRLLPSTRGIELETGARAVAGGLVRARSLAVLESRHIDYLVDLEAGSSGIEGDREPVQLPEWSTLDVTTARGLVAGDRHAAIRFFADGGSTGGRIALEAAGRRFRIDVAWLTGAVTVTEEGVP